MADIGAEDRDCSLQARIDTLRASGAAERDPVRFAHLDALIRRATTQPEAIRRTLDVRIGQLADALAAQPAPTPAVASANTPSPLAELLVYISQQAHEAQEKPVTTDAEPDLRKTLRPPSKSAAPGHAGRAPELKSVAYFRNTWSKLSTEQLLTQTLAQAPENAGPMNSQHLVLRSLQVMRDIAPDYLQGFMSYIDTLIWLEHADPTKPAASRSSTGSAEAKKPRTTKRSPTKQ